MAAILENGRPLKLYFDHISACIAHRALVTVATPMFWGSKNPLKQFAITADRHYWHISSHYANIIGIFLVIIMTRNMPIMSVRSAYIYNLDFCGYAHVLESVQ